MARLFAANLDSSSGQACQVLGNQHPNIRIMKAWMCLRNKCYGVTQSRSKVRPNCGKLEINAHAWEKVVLCHKFYAHLDVARIECLFEQSVLPILLYSVMPGSETVPNICHSNIWLHSIPILHSNTPLHRIHSAAQHKPCHEKTCLMRCEIRYTNVHCSETKSSWSFEIWDKAHVETLYYLGRD